MNDARLSNQPPGTAPVQGGEEARPNASETIARARAERAQFARAAAYFAHRVERAEAAGYVAEANRWAVNYRRSVSRCRQLGARIRAASQTQ